MTAALGSLPNDGESCTIFIECGTYNESISITRKGKTILRGETTYSNDYTRNSVMITYPGGASSNIDNENGTAVITTDENTSVALYNINF